MSINNESVYLLPNEIVANNDSKLMKLRNPHTNGPSYFLLEQKKQKLYEVQGFDEEHRSWFIKDKVYPDGCIKIITPYNPVYLILPYLIQATKNVPLDHLLDDDDYPSMTALVEAVHDLSCVADKKGPANLNVWSYNEKSTLNWLTEKVEQLASHLQESNEKPSLTSAVSSDKDAYRVLAFGILSEYLQEDLSIRLKSHLKLPEAPKLNESNADSKNNNNTKKTKFEHAVTDFVTPAKKIEIKQTAKEKALAKSAKGSKSITSFFSKK